MKIKLKKMSHYVSSEIELFIENLSLQTVISSANTMGAFQFSCFLMLKFILYVWSFGDISEIISVCEKSCNHLKSDTNFQKVSITCSDEIQEMLQSFVH